MGVGIVKSNRAKEFLEGMTSNVKRWKAKPQYAKDKAYRSGIDKISEAVEQGDVLSLEKQLHQLKTERASSVEKTFNSEYLQTGDRIFHNKIMKDTHGLPSNLKIEKL